MIIDDKRMYGVWIPGKGWLRGEKTFADYDIEKAKQVAYLIGNHAQVRFIDKSIEQLESVYLEQESKRKSLWHILTTFSKLKTSK